MPQSKDQCVCHSDYLILGTLRKQGCQHWEARKIFLHNPHILFKHNFTLVTLYASIFAQILLTPASPPEQNDEH